MVKRHRYLHRLLMVACAGIAAPPAAAAAVDARVEWVTPAVTAPRVTQQTFPSASAGCLVSYHVYVPAAYANDAARRFPVVYWLHGSGGGLPGIEPMARLIDAAIASGRLPPCLVVFVNGLKFGMYVDWKNGTVPLETVIVTELIPHVDATYRTVTTREGRVLDGFSMGGYGAARLGFKFPELFGAVSLMGAGPLQPDLREDAPRASQARAEEIMASVYGGASEYFLSVSPRALAERNAARIAEGSRVRLVVGTSDETYANNAAFHAHLQSLGIPHEWIVLEGVGHHPMRTLQVLGDRHWEFYREAWRGLAAPGMETR
jgi:enterochelin esterase-like enzyme